MLKMGDLMPIWGDGFQVSSLTFSWSEFLDRAGSIARDTEPTFWEDAL